MSGGQQLQPFRRMWGDRSVSQEEAKNDFDFFLSIMNTINQLFFTSKKFLRGLQESPRHEYFSPQTSHCSMATITTQV